MSRILSFRGLLASGGQDTIVLHTNDGSTGYRIVKFELIAPEPGVTNAENVVKIYKTKQTAVDGEIDFSENIMLAAGYYAAESSSYSDNKTIVFDNEIFNQDIYVTNKDNRGSGLSTNYYIELEQVLLDLNQSTVATLKNIRNND